MIRFIKNANTLAVQLLSHTVVRTGTSPFVSRTDPIKINDYEPFWSGSLRNAKHSRPPVGHLNTLQKGFLNFD